jgi:hypothetical protein
VTRSRLREGDKMRLEDCDLDGIDVISGAPFVRNSPDSEAVQVSRLLRLSVWFAIAFCGGVDVREALAAKPKTPKMAVQLYGVDRSFSTEPCCWI